MSKYDPRYVAYLTGRLHLIGWMWDTSPHEIERLIALIERLDITIENLTNDQLDELCMAIDWLDPWKPGTAGILPVAAEPRDLT
jgi:predicted DNA-binding helix-hairpin-helix protein